ncbi:MAG: metal-dependent transcriptional regulator [Caldisericaceae bacterium]
MKYSKNIEDYLEAIYVLSEDKGFTRVKDIAKFLNVKLPSVTEILKKLQEGGLVEHSPYGEVKLTEKGIYLGKEVWDKHKIIYSFLKNFINVKDEVAFKEACLVEHSLSKETIEKLKEFIKSLKK